MANARQFMAARTGAWSGGGAKKPTARDYVQDGLIHMWDGIENAGYENHVDSATSWKDLVGSINLSSMPSGRSIGFSSNGATLNGIDERFTNSTAFAPKTIECVFSADEDSLEAVVFTCSTSYLDIGITLVAGDGKFYIPTSYLKTGFELDVGMPSSVCLVKGSDYYGAQRAYKNGDPVATKSIIRGWGYPYSQTNIGYANKGVSGYLKGTVFAVRCYSRNLAPEEIAANYAIDKARFGLP